MIQAFDENVGVHESIRATVAVLPVTENWSIVGQLHRRPVRKNSGETDNPLATTQETIVI